MAEGFSGSKTVAGLWNEKATVYMNEPQEASLTQKSTALPVFLMYSMYTINEQQNTSKKERGGRGRNMQTNDNERSDDAGVLHDDHRELPCLWNC